jgi:hypothetical protein
LALALLSQNQSQKKGLTTMFALFWAKQERSNTSEQTGGAIHDWTNERANGIPSLLGSFFKSN